MARYTQKRFKTYGPQENYNFSSRCVVARASD